jgi:hypothetical protein
MAYSLAKLKSNGDKASPYFRPLWIENASDKCLPTRTLLQGSFKQILISLTNFIGNYTEFNENCVILPLTE